MKTLLFLIGTFLLLITSLQARLGETEAQIEARYGKPIDILPPDLDGTVIRKRYDKNFMQITVSYLSGKSAEEEIKHENAASTPLTKNEIESLLAANTLGNKWVQVKGGERIGDYTWQLENGTATATCTAFVFIDITSKELEKAYEDKKSKDEAVKANSTQGF